MHCNTLLQGWGDLGENCLHAAEVPGAKAGMVDKETTMSPAQENHDPPWISVI